MDETNKPKRKYQLEYYHRHKEERLQAQRNYRNKKTIEKNICFAKEIIKKYPSYFIKT